MNLDIRSWNVNGLRAAERHGFLTWLEGCGADVVFLQEIKARPEQLSDEMRAPAGWHAEFFPAERPGYSGTAVYCREKPDEVMLGIGVKKYDAEGRSIGCRYGKLWVHGAYFPNGGNDLARVPFKLGFYRSILTLMNQQREAGHGVICGGDYNTCHQPKDLARPKQNEKNTGFLPEERAVLDRWQKRGWVDSFRHLHPDQEDAYSWWSYRAGARGRNIGWRLDMHWVNEEFAGNIVDAGIEPDAHGSDHCPVRIVVKA
jgi:exodeoxyribonuclease-3